MFLSLESLVYWSPVACMFLLLGPTDWGNLKNEGPVDCMY